MRIIINFQFILIIAINTSRLMEICLSLVLFIIGIWGNSIEHETPYAAPEELDALLAEKRYKKFSRLMNIEDPELASSSELNITQYEAMFNKKLRGGDMLISPINQEKGRQGYKFDKWPGSRWPVRRVPYTISNEFDNDQKWIIRRTIARWNREVRCIKWYRRRDEHDYVHIFPGRGCWARFGRIGGQQPLSLDKGWCIRENLLTHEMMHSVGFSHEHNRPDRDNYIEILWDNLWEGYGFLYNMDSADDVHFDDTYDYYSIMHYEITRGASDNKKAYEVLTEGVDERQIGAGRNNGLTEIDIRKVNSLYCNN